MQNNLTTDQIAEQANKVKITASNSSLVLNVQQFKKITYQEQPNQCRICLQSTTSIFNKLINPCGCDGTVKFVHEECMKKWLSSIILTKNKQQRIRIKLMGIECQMCKLMIKFQMQEQVVCRTCDQIKNQYYNRRILFIVLLIMIMVSLGGVIGTTYYVVDFIVNSKEKQISFYFSIILGADILMLLIMIVGLLIFTTEYLLQKTLQIGDIIEDKIPPRKKKFNRKKMIPFQQVNSIQHFSSSMSYE